MNTIGCGVLISANLRMVIIIVLWHCVRGVITGARQNLLLDIPLNSQGHIRTGPLCFWRKVSYTRIN